MAAALKGADRPLVTPADDDKIYTDDTSAVTPAVQDAAYTPAALASYVLGKRTLVTGTVLNAGESTDVCDTSPALLKAMIVAVGAGAKINLTATAAPTATDDETDGYSAMSAWLWPAQNRIWFCSVASTNVAVWVEVEGFANPMTATGDLLVGGVDGAASRLGVGADGKVLGVDSGAVAWIEALTNPMTTAADIIVGGAAGAPGRLGVGADGKVLGVASGALAWVDPSGGGLANPMTTAGDIIVAGAAGAAGRLAIGSENQVLSPDETGDLVWRDEASGSLPALDTVALVKDPTDNTKLARIDAGLISTGTTRALQVPDGDAMAALDSQVFEFFVSASLTTMDPLYCFICEIPITLVAWSGTLYEAGTEDVQLQIRKNDTLVSTPVNTLTLATPGAFNNASMPSLYGYRAAKISFAAGDLVRVDVINSGEGLGTMVVGTPATGPLRLKFTYFYDAG